MSRALCFEIIHFIANNVLLYWIQCFSPLFHRCVQAHVLFSYRCVHHHLILNEEFQVACRLSLKNLAHLSKTQLQMRAKCLLLAAGDPFIQFSAVSKKIQGQANPKESIDPPECDRDFNLYVFQFLMLYKKCVTCFSSCGYLVWSDSFILSDTYCIL